MKTRDTPHYISTKKLIHLQSAILFLLLALLSTLTVLRFQRDNDIHAIQGVITIAMVTPASITVGNPAPLNLSKNSITAASLRQTSASISLARSKAQATFSSIYAPGCSNCQNFASNIEASLAAEAKGQIHGLGGGIRDIEWRQVLIDGSTASVTVAATIWSRYAYLDEWGKVEMAAPTGKYVTTYALTKFNGHWLITNLGKDSGP